MLDDRLSGAETRRLELLYGNEELLYGLDLLGLAGPFYRVTPWELEDERGVRRINAEFWLRSVADHPRGTYPGQPWTFWQYTGTGTATGFRGNVDLNAFAGSRAQWNRWVASRSQR